MRPPKPEPLTCKTCGLEVDWEWDEDLEHPQESVWWPTRQWWGPGSVDEYYHSRRCWLVANPG